MISWTYKSRPLDMGDEEFVAAEYGDWDVNQFLEIATRGERVGVPSIDTGGDLQSWRRFCDFLVPRFGFTDELRVVFRVRGLTWSALAVYRGAGEPPFTADEAQVAAPVHMPVAELIHSVLFHSAGRHVRPPRETQPTDTEPTPPDTSRPHALNRLWCDAINAGDLPALMVTYEPDAVIVPGPGAVPSTVTPPSRSRWHGSSVWAGRFASFADTGSSRANSPSRGDSRTVGNEVFVSVGLFTRCGLLVRRAGCQGRSRRSG